MKQKILDAGLAVLLVGAVIAMIYMMGTVKQLSEDNEQLQQENNDLLLDKIQLEIELGEALDANWQFKNQLMMEGEGD